MQIGSLTYPRGNVTLRNGLDPLDDYPDRGIKGRGLSQLELCIRVIPGLRGERLSARMNLIV